MGRPFGLAAALLAGCAIAACSSTQGSTGAETTPAPTLAPPVSCPGRATPSTASAAPALSPSPVLPHGGAPAGLPPGGGFDAYAVIQPGVLRRSGTPTSDQWDFLRGPAAIKGVVDVRTTDDLTYAGFAQYGFKYLNVPVVVDTAPADDQVAVFLCFVTNPVNQPVLVHDNTGRERVGLFVALYRYSVQGWPMAAALQEETAFGNTLTNAQTAYLNSWALRHRPAEVRL